MRKPVFILLAMIFALTACGGPDQTVGTLGGAVAGGVVGSQIGRGGGKPAMTDLGVLLGAWLGSDIGASMDQADRQRSQQAERRAYTAPVGQQITWRNPDTSNAGTIIPVRDGYADSGAYCREFQQTITIDGQQRQGYGKACQQPDETWKIVK